MKILKRILIGSAIFFVVIIAVGLIGEHFDPQPSAKNDGSTTTPTSSPAASVKPSPPSTDALSDQSNPDATSKSLDSHAVLSADDIVKRALTIPNVISVGPPTDKNGSNFVVSVKQGSIFEGGNTSKDVLHTIANHATKTGYTGVQINMVETVVDRFGNNSDVPILRLAFPRTDVEKFNYENIVGWNVLDVASVYTLNPISPQIVSQECAPDSENAKFAPDFCAAAPVAEAPPGS